MDQSLYEGLGGKETVEKATQYLYVHILNDERINSYFDGIDIEKQRRKMSAFLTYIFGGPSLYLGKDMRRAHKGAVEKGLNDEHVDAMIECVKQALSDLAIGRDLATKVISKIEEHRDDVLCR